MKKNTQNIPIETDEIEETTTNITKSGIVLDTSIEMSFFYTNDKNISELDDTDILNKFNIKYPSLNSKNNDFIIKKTVIQILNDEKFVKNVLKYHSITIYDFFKILFKQYNSIFSTAYLNKIKRTIADKNYEDFY